MAVRGGDVQWIVELKDDVSKGLAKVTDKMEAAGKAAVPVAAAYAAVGAAVVKTTQAFADFQGSMNNVKALTQATEKEMDKLKAQALEMGQKTKFSAKESADAMGFLAMAGLNTNQIMEALPGTLQLAAAGNLELAEAADIATNVMSGMALPISRLGELNDTLAATAASSNTNIRQLGNAMSYAAPLAASAGVSVQETSAAIGILANAGLQGERGGTALRGA